MKTSMTTSLFDPLTLRGKRFRNRIWVSPMCQYSVEKHDGVPTDWHLLHLGSLARGGAGLVMTESTAIVPDGRISAKDVGLWNDEQTRAWTRVVSLAHDNGALIGVQLSHAGRKASVYPEWEYVDGSTVTSSDPGNLPVEEGGWPTVAPSPLAFEGLATPRALSVSEIEDVVEAFVTAGRRAVDAGFDLVEIHAAHGYLLHEFLSPLANHRDDQYGGSLENRARMLLDVVRGLRQELGDSLPIFVRFSGTDWVEGGWDVAQTATVAGWCRDEGADFFDISSGGAVRDVHIPAAPGYQVELAESVRRIAQVPVSAVGLITDPHQAAVIVGSEQADAVMLGREFMRDPHFALTAARELGVAVDYWPPQYWRARR